MRPGEWMAVDLAMNNGRVVLARGFLTLVPGLVVNRAPGDAWCPCAWRVTHVRSGLSVGHCDDPESGQAMAVALGGLGDWSQPAEDIIESHGRAAIREAVQRYGVVHGNLDPLERAMAAERARR